MTLVFLTPENTGMEMDELLALTHAEVIEAERDILGLRINELTPTQKAELSALPDASAF